MIYGVGVKPKNRPIDSDKNSMPATISPEFEPVAKE